MSHAEDSNEKGNRTKFVNTDKLYAKAKHAKIVKEKEPPIRMNVTTPLTTEHRQEIKELITEWVTTSNLAKKPIGHGKAYSLLYTHDDGLAGAVNGIDQIEDDEFEQCRAFIKTRIRILESNDSGGLTRKKDDWRNGRIRGIQTRRRKAGISDETFKAYLRDRWGDDSLVLLSDDDLEACYRYAMSGSPKWIPPKEQTPGLQALREKALAKWLEEMEADAVARGEPFDRGALRINGKKDVIRTLLAERDRTLFCDDSGQPISVDAFNAFWKAQQLCKVAGGRPAGEKPKT